MLNQPELVETDKMELRKHERGQWNIGNVHIEPQVTGVGGLRQESQIPCYPETHVSIQGNHGRPGTMGHVCFTLVS